MNTAPAYFYRIEKMRELSPAQVGTVPCFHKGGLCYVKNS